MKKLIVFLCAVFLFHNFAASQQTKCTKATDTNKTASPSKTSHDGTKNYVEENNYGICRPRPRSRKHEEISFPAGTMSTVNNAAKSIIYYTN